jgi:hypothetical protein
MQIRKFAALAVVFAVLGLAPSSFGQIGAQTHIANPVLGFYDPATGTFQPLLSNQAEVPAVVPTTGTLTMKYTITVDATIPSHGVVSCTGTAGTNDGSNIFTESGTAIATLVSGKTYSCSVIIHYSWLLATPTTDKIGFSGSADLLYGLQVTASNGTAVVVQPVSQRHSSQSIAPISVPANGASTTVSINSTL